MPTPIEKVYSIRLAVQGENATTPIEIDMTTWAEEFPNANFYVLFKPYNEQNIVPVITEYDAPILKWIPTSSITAIVGVGFAEVRAVDASTGLVKKSRIIPTSIENSVSGNEGIEPPAAYSDWVNSVLANKDAAVSAKAAAIAAAETAEEAASTAVAQTGLIDEVILVQDDEPTAEHNKLYIKKTQPEAVEIATEAELTALRTEVQGDLAEIQEDVQGVESDVATLQTDVHGVENDVATLQTDVQGVESDVATLQEDVQDLQETTEETQRQVSESVKYTSQTLTDAQKTQARENIGAADQEDVADLESAMNSLEGEVADKYEKPATGIPASDLASGVIPSVPVQDVQVDGTSILDAQGVANVPVASENEYGVVKVNNAGGLSGIRLENGTLKIIPVTSAAVKAGNGNWVQLVPSHQHESTFYGLTKAAGVDMASSSNPVGTYTDEAKIAIQKMLGVYKEPYRLIKEIVIMEETLGVYVISDSGDNPFLLTDVIIHFQALAATNAGTLGIGVNIGKNVYESGKTFMYCSNVLSTTARTSIAHVWVDGGRFFGQYSGDALAQQYSQTNLRSSHNAMGVISSGLIYELYIESSNGYKLTAGTITIYGR